MKPAISLALSLLLAGPLNAAQEPGHERARELQNLLVQDCGSCHGLTMQGGLGPPLSAQRLSGRSPESLAAVILHGRPGTAMPPWQALLTPDEARWIAERLLQGDPK
jgi:cytochrome c55X